MTLVRCAQTSMLSEVRFYKVYENVTERVNFIRAQACLFKELNKGGVIDLHG